MVTKFNTFEALDPKILDSFEIQETLNPLVWDGFKLKDGIKEKLMELASDFVISLGVNVTIKDVVFTGSLANFNWSQYSDVDLHVVVDFKELDVNEDFLMSFFLSAIANWNEKHKVTVYGFGVEIFVEDSNKGAVSSGVYSLMKDEWLKKPSKDKNTFENKDSVRLKSEYLMYEIDEIEKLSTIREWDAVIKGIKYIKLRLRIMRTRGLAEGGEYSTENLAYKVLRREGYLDKLNDMAVLAYDQMHSLE